jgi:hypothetical protein
VQEDPKDKQDPAEEGRQPQDESELDDLDPEEQGEDVKGGGSRPGGTSSSSHW